MTLPTAPIVTGSLVGGYLVARETKRQLGGVVLAAGGITAGRAWLADSGPATTAVLSALYLGAFGASHPLARKIGAWPAVFTAAGVAGLGAWALHDRTA